MADEPMKVDARAAGGGGFVVGLALGVVATMGMVVAPGPERPGPEAAAPGSAEISADPSTEISITTDPPAVGIVDAQGQPVIFFTSDAAVEARAREIAASRQAAYEAEERARLEALPQPPAPEIFHTTEGPR